MSTFSGRFIIGALILLSPELMAAAQPSSVQGLGNQAQAEAQAEQFIKMSKPAIAEVVGPRVVKVGEYTEWSVVMSDSKTAKNNPYRYDIDWGDGMKSVSGNGHSYARPGEYEVVFSLLTSSQAKPYKFKVKVVADPKGKNSKFSPWGRKLGVSLKGLPRNSFREYVFDPKTFKNYVRPEVVKQPYFDYPQDRFGGYGAVSESHRLAGYWVGEFTFSKDTELKFDISNTQWSVARAYVNGKELERPESDADLVHFFKKGKYTIEFEYQVNWHAGTFMARLTSPSEKYMEFKEALVEAYKLAGTEAEIIKGPKFPSTDVRGNTKVSFKNTSASKILILNSYSPTVWQVSELEKNNIKAVIVASYEGGSDISGQGTIPVFRVRSYYDDGQ